MNAQQFMYTVASPWVLGLYAAVCVAALLAYRLLRRQWTRPGSARSTRARELAALGIVTFTALALVAFGNSLLLERVAQADALGRLQDKTLLASQLRERIARELDAVRILLADSTVQKIAHQRLVEARADLARFAAFQDPNINRMITLIDSELEIRELLDQSLLETAPGKLLPIYQRLTQLAPSNADYQEKAAQLQALTKN